MTTVDLNEEIKKGYQVRKWEENGVRKKKFGSTFYYLFKLTFEPERVVLSRLNIS